MVQNILQNNEGSLSPAAVPYGRGGRGIGNRQEDKKLFPCSEKLFEYHIEAISSYSVERERDMVNL